MQNLLILLALSIALPTKHASAGTVYSVNYNDTISVISTSDESVTTPVTLISGSKPTAICLNPITPRAYTLNSGDNTISVIDTALKTVVTTISSLRFTDLVSIACDPTGTSVLIGNNSAADTSNILYLNTATLTLESGDTPVDSNPGSIVFNRNGSRAYILSQGLPSVSVIDTSTRQIAIGPVTLTEADAPYTLAMHTRDKYLYVVNLLGSYVAFYNPETMSQHTTVNTGVFPSNIVVSHTTNQLYVVNSDDTVSIIDPELESLSSTFNADASAALIERNDGQKVYTASMFENFDSVSMYDTADFSAPPVQIALPYYSSPQALATLLGTRYNLTLDLTGIGSGSVNWPFNVTYPQTTSTVLGIPEGIGITATASADSCSTVSWTGCDANDGNGTAEALCTVTSLAANKTVNAVFSKNVHSITSSVIGGTGSLICPTSEVCDGTPSTCSITPATGYHISDVLVDGSSVGAVSNYTFSNVTAPHTISATFGIDTFTINAAAATNGGITPAGTTSVSYGSGRNYTITPVTGYHIADVVVDGTSVGAVAAYTFYDVTTSHTISASFAVNTFPITTSVGSNGSISPAGTSAVNYGSGQGYTITPVTGYHIADVLVDGISVGAVGGYIFYNVTTSHTISASFAIDTFAITASAGSNGSISPAGATAVNYGSGQSYAITPNSGYHVTDVLVDGTSIGVGTSHTFSNVTIPHTISASFAINTFAITATAGSNGSISPTGTSIVSYNGTQSYTIIPNSGYHIADVLVDGISVGVGASYTFNNVTIPHTITATFAINTFSITASAGGNGGISPEGSTTLAYGSSQSYTITPISGYHIADVLADGSSVGVVASYTFNNITAPHTISATFAIDTFSISVSATSGGAISPASLQMVNYNGSLTVEITPAAGFSIIDVLADDISQGTPGSYIFTNVTANHTISVKFADITAPNVSIGSAPPNPTRQTSATFDFSSTDTSATFECSLDSSNFADCTTPVTYASLTEISHIFRVRAKDAAGNVTTLPAGHSWTVDTTPPDNGSVTATPGNGQVTLSWAPFSDSSSGVTSYLLVKGDTGTTPDFCNGGTAAASGQTITGLNNDISFDFRICAIDAAGNVSAGTVVSATPRKTFVAVSPPTYNFGSQAFGTDSSPATLTFTSTNATDVNITGFSLVGAQAGNFYQSGGSCGAPPFSLAPLASCTVEISFKPTTAAQGASGALFTATSDESDNPIISATLGGIATYAITASAGSNGSISPAGTTIINDGSSQSYSSTPAPGYHIVDLLVDGISTGAVASYTFNTIAANHTINATFAVDTFDLSASAGSNGSISPSGSTTVSYNGNQSYTIIPNSSYHIVNLLVDGVSQGAVDHFTFSNVDKGHTITATFALNTYTITATSGTGGGISSTATVGYGSNKSFTITPNTGYHIADVHVDGASVGAVASYTFNAIASQHTISATFAISTFTISASAGTNGGITPANVSTASYGFSQSYSIAPNSGYHISDVIVDGTSIGAFTSYTFNNVTASHTISATFAIDTFNITTSAGSNGSITPAGTKAVNYGSNQSYSITPDSGYHIATVLVDGISGGAVAGYAFSNITASHTISATFAIDTFTITASSGGNGSISPTGITTVSYNGHQSYTITPNSGYHLADLLVDGISVGAVASYTFNNIAANHTISATFAINTFAISASAGTNGSITPADVTTTNYGSSQSYTITPNNGYHIADVLVDGSNVGAVTGYTFNNITVPHTISAAFAIDTFAISASAGTNGSISPAGTTTVNYGSNRSYTIVPNAGYHITSVLVDGISQGTPGSYLFSNVDSSRTITATFAVDTFIITTATGTGGTITCSSPAAFGNSSACLIKPDIGYHLLTLTDNGTSMLTSVTGKNSYTVQGVTAPHAVTASFAAYSLADALQALRIAVGIALPKPGEHLWLDVAPLDTGKPKGNDVIDIMDALVLLKRSIGTYTTW